MSFFPCGAIVFALWPSITAALAAWSMRRMKKSEKVNPNSRKVWAKEPNQGKAWASLHAGAGPGARVRQPMGHCSPAEEECGHQQQKFPTVTAEMELRGTTSEAGEKEQPLAHSVLASLWRTISQIAFLWCGHLSAGSCLATALISRKALNCYQPGKTFSHCWPGLHLDWQLGGGRQSVALPQFKSLELSSPPQGSEVYKACVY